MIPSHKPLVYIISAPSGSGKSTLVNKVLNLIPDLNFSISYTTRAARGREQDGKQYYFVSRAEFEQMIRANAFLEHANVFGNYYGTARRFLTEAQEEGHDLLLDIDVQGAAQIKRTLPDAVTIFVLPPDRNTLEQRLRERGEDAGEVIHRRLVTATREIENYDKYDYILINDVLDESVESLLNIVLAGRFERLDRPLTLIEEQKVELADSCRLAKMQNRLEPILASFRKAHSPAR